MCWKLIGLPSLISGALDISVSFKAAILAEKVPDIPRAVEFPKLSWGLWTWCRGSYSFLSTLKESQVSWFFCKSLYMLIRIPQKDRRWERPWSVKDKAYTRYQASQLGVWRILASVNLAILQSFSSFFFFFLSQTSIHQKQILASQTHLRNKALPFKSMAKPGV